MKRLVLLSLLLAFARPAAAMTTEVGLSYGLKGTTYDQDNNTKSESVTGSVSLYFTEKLALELSYTQAKAIENTKVIVTGGTVAQDQTVVQKTTAYGADLIWVMMDKTALLQPYIKGGAAQIEREQSIDDRRLNYGWTIPKVSGVAPDYGAGFKIALTQEFGVKVSYDIQMTPLGNGQYSSDEGIRAGMTWIF